MAASGGGHFAAHSPLQTSLPDEAAPLSNTYWVMPAGSVSAPADMRGGIRMVISFRTRLEDGFGKLAKV